LNVEIGTTEGMICDDFCKVTSEIDFGAFIRIGVKLLYDHGFNSEMIDQFST